MAPVANVGDTPRKTMAGINEIIEPIMVRVAGRSRPDLTGLVLNDTASRPIKGAFKEGRVEHTAIRHPLSQSFQTEPDVVERQMREN